MAYFLLWWLVKLPATSQAWWATDDYAHAINWHWRHNYEQGRPLSNLLTYTLTWESGAAGETLNIVFRATQGLLHAGVAAGIAGLLFVHTRSRAALVAPVLFLLWPTSDEAVLWRAAAAIPVASLISVAGALLVNASAKPRRGWFAVLGAALVAAAMLVQQLGAATGLIAWTMVLATQNRPAESRDLKKAVWLAAGYVLGAVASMRIARHWLGDLPGRDQLAIDWWAKADYLNWLWTQTLLTPHNSLQRSLQVAILALVLVAIALHLFLYSEPAWAKVVRLTAMASLIVLPFLPLLLTATSPTSGRVFYLAPLLLVTALVAADPWLERLLHAPHGIAVAAGALVVVLLPTAYISAADYPAVYQSDLQALSTVNARLRAQQPDGDLSVVIADPSLYLTTFDIFDTVELDTADSKRSAFIYTWSNWTFAKWRAGWLAPLEGADRQLDMDRVDVCSQACLTRESVPGGNRRFEFLSLENERATCVCP